MGDVPEELTICGSEEQLEGCCGKIVICERNPRNKNQVYYIFCQEICMWEWDAKRDKKRNSGGRAFENSGKAWIFTGADPCTWKHRSEKEEAGLLELADSLGVEFLTYSAESLQEISAVSSSSEFVRGVTGVDNVCERAAKRMCPDGVMVQEKVCLNQCTAAFVCGEVMVKFRKEEEER